MGGTANFYRVLVLKKTNTDAVWDTRAMWEVNIKMGLKFAGLELNY